MQNYEEMKAQVLTAIAMAVTAEEIKKEDEAVIVDDIANIADYILVDGTRSGMGFTADAHSEGEEPVLCHFMFRELEAERERLLNKPEWPEDKQWQARAVDADGEWYFYTKEAGRKIFPGICRFILIENVMWSGLYNYANSRAHAFPAGYDWKESLEFRQS